MKLLGYSLCLAMLLVATCLATSASAKDGAAAERKLNIDPALRKALLRALRHLKDRQEEEKQEQLLGDANTTEENFATTILDELLEESTVAEGQEEARVRGSDTPAIDYHTYVASNPRDETDTIESEVEQQESGPVTIGSEGANEIIKTIIIAKPKSTLSTPKLESENEIVPQPAALDGSTVAVRSTATSSTTTSPLPAAATTIPASPVPTSPAPTHNEDGENIEQVKSEDVKIFQAPLVAAFTVQQDQLGVSRNVIPLLQTPPKQQSSQSAPDAHANGSDTAASSGPGPTLLPPLVTATASADVTRALEEKTRQLEQQLITLQNQQRAQEQLLRAKLQQEQAIIQQQQLQLQQQKQRLEEETRLRIQRFEQDQRLFRQQQQQQQLFQQHQHQQQFQQQPPTQQQLPPFKPQQQPLAQQPTFIQELPRPGPAVQFIPSVSLPGGKPIAISVEQQLPFKEAVDFQLAHLPQQAPSQTGTTVEQVKAISQPASPLPPQLASDQALPLKPFQPFNPFPVLPPLLVGPSPFDQQLPLLQQRNRVFRQEPSTGNFGLRQQPFRPSQPLAFASDSQNLQNLLFQSGITSRSAEDFNIITKVLALNHGIPQASSQRMFAKLSPEEQRQLLFRK